MIEAEITIWQCERSFPEGASPVFVDISGLVRHRGWAMPAFFLP